MRYCVYIVDSYKPSNQTFDIFLINVFFSFVFRLLTSLIYAQCFLSFAMQLPDGMKNIVPVMIVVQHIY